MKEEEGATPTPEEDDEVKEKRKYKRRGDDELEPFVSFKATLYTMYPQLKRARREIATVLPPRVYKVQDKFDRSK